MNLNLSILGPPGSGKGTQASGIVEKFGVVHISTGDMLREAVRNKTALGEKAQGFMNSGQLVPDELIIAMVQERIQRADCAKGFLLDGFPRTIPQAQKLDELGPRLDWVLSMEISEEECVKRLCSRKSCPQCSATYNVLTNPPKKTNQCDRCDSALVQRPDDRPETVLARLKVYNDQTAPLIDYFRKTNRLLSVNASLSLEAVCKQINNLLQSNVSSQK